MSWVALTVITLPFWLFCQTDAARLLRYIWIHSSYFLIHFLKRKACRRRAMGRQLCIYSLAASFTAVDSHWVMLPPSPLLTLLCLNIFVHFAKFLKHLLPPPLLLCSGMSLAKACDQNDFPHQKAVLPSSGLTPAEYLFQHKSVSGLQSLATSIQIFFAFLYFPFHCTRLTIPQKKPDKSRAWSSYQQFTFAFSDYPQVCTI